MGAKKGEGVKPIASNRRARYDYQIEETIEAGLQLRGTEVKSCREGRVNFSDSYATIEGGEAWLLRLHVGPYSHGGSSGHDPTRPRKLLLHRREIERLATKVHQEGRTLVPLRLYFRNGLVKAEIAVARGKKVYDKRAAIAEREARRRMQRRSLLPPSG